MPEHLEKTDRVGAAGSLRSEPLAALPGLRHAFFTREGGASHGLYAGLNCGFGSGDVADSVTENRRRAAETLGVAADKLLTVFQVHSPDVVTVESPWAREDSPHADAMVTNTPGLALGILTADCGPVLFADAEAGVVGAAHAGWKGALTGVLENTIEAMERLGADRRRIQAAVGPCIAQDSYEVGTEFEERFLAADPKNAEFFRRPPGAERPHFDLPGYIAKRLATAGIDAPAVVPNDTYADEALFYSYRRATHRGEPDYGRGLSAICLES